MVDYQENYTDNPVARKNMYDHDGRGTKAGKIIAVLSDHCGELSRLSILDVSCSTGLMAKQFAPHFAKVTGIDIDASAVGYAQRNNDLSNIQFYEMDALHMAFPDSTFNIVVCNQMYEHVPDPVRLMSEIRRVLAPGGICYFGATNRLKIVETHYGRLPFLSYLPKPLANLYLRVLGRGRQYYENLYTYWTLKRLCNDFEITDYTETVIRRPEYFAMGDIVGPGSATQKIALLVLRYAYWFSPGYIWLLRKSALEQRHSE